MAMVYLAPQLCDDSTMQDSTLVRVSEIAKLDLAMWFDWKPV